MPQDTASALLSAAEASVSEFFRPGVLISGVVVTFLAVWILPVSIDMVTGAAQLGIQVAHSALENAFGLGADKDNFILASGESLDERLKKGTAPSSTLDYDSSDEKITPSGSKYPGLLNAGGNTCFLNATLQALSSISALSGYLSAIIRLGQSFEVDTPVCTSLYQMATALATPASSRKTLHPRPVAQALYDSSPSRRRLMNNEQQDAQEFYVMLIEAVQDELDVCEEEICLDEGLAAAISNVGDMRRPLVKNPFKALMAHRTACLQCGYTEAVRHLPSEQLTLVVPSTSVCDLRDLMASFTTLETLDEFSCRRCAVSATHARLAAQLETRNGGPSGTVLSSPPTASKKKRTKELRRTVERLAQMKSSNPEATPPVNLDRPPPRKATKQTMFARPPQTLVVHLSRSTMYTMTGHALKNNAHVVYPRILDLTPYCTSGVLTTQASTSMSPAKPSATSVPDAAVLAQQHLYKLVAIVVHYGSHQFGHYVTFRDTVNGWKRVSDEDVSDASEQEALNSNPFLLFYERPQSTTAAQSQSPSQSQSVSECSVVHQSSRSKQQR